MPNKQLNDTTGISDPETCCIIVICNCTLLSVSLTLYLFAPTGRRSEPFLPIKRLGPARTRRQTKKTHQASHTIKKTLIENSMESGKTTAAGVVALVAIMVILQVVAAPAAMAAVTSPEDDTGPDSSSLVGVSGNNVGTQRRLLQGDFGALGCQETCYIFSCWSSGYTCSSSSWPPCCVGN